MMTREDIISLLEKKAKGGVEEETREEYVSDKEDNLRISKKSVVKKVYLPDTQALMKLIDINKEDTDYSTWTDEELIEERERLLKLLAEGQIDI